MHRDALLDVLDRALDARGHLAIGDDAAGRSHRMDQGNAGLEQGAQRAREPRRFALPQKTPDDREQQLAAIDRLPELGPAVRDQARAPKAGHGQGRAKDDFKPAVAQRQHELDAGRHRLAALLEDRRQRRNQAADDDSERPQAERDEHAGIDQSRLDPRLDFRAPLQQVGQFDKHIVERSTDFTGPDNGDVIHWENLRLPGHGVGQRRAVQHRGEQIIDQAARAG